MSCFSRGSSYHVCGTENALSQNLRYRNAKKLCDFRNVSMDSHDLSIVPLSTAIMPFAWDNSVHSGFAHDGNVFQSTSAIATQFIWLMISGHDMESIPGKTREPDRNIWSSFLK